ncbi:hypothetical protein BGZ63DRAFT_187012 [Mariannaea sp. PMI_226]|nr:hypothetical protein BGZ63DRAFT_187012 [Mariannaea sp. PMI_226]
MVSLSHIFPPSPGFTEKDLPDLTSKTFLITGPTSGLGLQLAALLYSKNGSIYLAARSRPKLNSTVEEIQSMHPNSKGSLHPLDLDLGSYESIKSAAAQFLSESQRLDVLFHNAGVLAPPKGSENAHGVELQMGVHCLGPYLLTHLLESALRHTAYLPGAKPGETRVVWVGSSGAILTPKGGVNVEDLRSGKFLNLSPTDRYGASKAGEYFLHGKYSKRFQGSGIISAYLDPGNLKTDLQRTFSTEVSRIGSVVLNLFLCKPIQGAYTELFAGLSPDVTVEALQNLENWVIPYGRIAKIRQDLADACKEAVEQQSGHVMDFYSWCDEQLKDYL